MEILKLPLVTSAWLCKPSIIISTKPLVTAPPEQLTAVPDMVTTAALILLTVTVPISALAENGPIFCVCKTLRHLSLSTVSSNILPEGIWPLTIPVLSVQPYPYKEILSSVVLSRTIAGYSGLPAWSLITALKSTTGNGASQFQNE